jgi:hypothetical protein
MAGKGRFSMTYLKSDVNRWFDDRERIFLYHYVSDPLYKEWKDLSPTGCRYVGWTPLDYRTRGEIWLYPTTKHRTMVQMLLPPEHLLWKKQFMRLRRERRKHDREYVNTIQKMISNNSKYYFYR